MIHQVQIALTFQIKLKEKMNSRELSSQFPISWEMQKWHFSLITKFYQSPVTIFHSIKTQFDQISIRSNSKLWSKSNNHISTSPLKIGLRFSDTYLAKFSMIIRYLARILINLAEILKYLVKTIKFS